MGRPTTYSPEIAGVICISLAEGLSLREICRKDEMPGLSTVFQWLAKHKDFAERYARAREAQADHMAEELLEIADDARNDWVEGENGEAVLNHEHVTRSRLRVDTRKWLMSKLLPRKYGDKVQHTGPDGNEPVTIVMNGIKRDK